VHAGQTSVVSGGVVPHTSRSKRWYCKHGGTRDRPATFAGCMHVGGSSARKQGGHASSRRVRVGARAPLITGATGGAHEPTTCPDARTPPPLPPPPLTFSHVLARTLGWYVATSTPLPPAPEPPPPPPPPPPPLPAPPAGTRLRLAVAGAGARERGPARDAAARACTGTGALALAPTPRPSASSSRSSATGADEGASATLPPSLSPSASSLLRTDSTSSSPRWVVGAPAGEESLSSSFTMTPSQQPAHAADSSDDSVARAAWWNGGGGTTVCYRTADRRGVCVCSGLLVAMTTGPMPCPHAAISPTETMAAFPPPPQPRHHHPTFLCSGCSRVIALGHGRRDAQVQPTRVVEPRWHGGEGAAQCVPTGTQRLVQQASPVEVHAVKRQHADARLTSTQHDCAPVVIGPARRRGASAGGRSGRSGGTSTRGQHLRACA
jgi:hypothetical protein